MVIIITTNFDGQRRRCHSEQSLKGKWEKRMRKHTLVTELLDLKLVLLSKVCIGTLKYLAHASSPRDCVSFYLKNSTFANEIEVQKEMASDKKRKRLSEKGHSVQLAI